MTLVELQVGDKLYYINKHTGELGTVNVVLIDVSFFTITYNGKPFHLPAHAIGSRLFFSAGDAWEVWHRLHTPETSKPDEKEKPKKKPIKPEVKASEPPKPKDKLFRCAECGRKFVWTIGEQEFYKSKGLTPPRTCSKECRERRNQIRIRSIELGELYGAMQPSEPYRTGSNAKNPVHVSGGVVAEISEWIAENMEKGYTNIF